LINLGFKSVEQFSTGFNMAVAYTVKNAITGAYPDYEVDYAKVLISQGPLNAVAGLNIVGEEAGKLTFNWTNNSSNGLASETDKAVILIYSQDSGRYIFTTEGSARNTGTHQFDLQDLSGEQVHVWMAFASENGRLFSTSIYGGIVSIS